MCLILFGLINSVPCYEGKIIIIKPKLAFLQILHQQFQHRSAQHINTLLNGLGEITRTHAHSPRIFRAFSARTENARRMRGEYAENTRRMRGEYASAQRVLSAYYPRILRALKN